MEKITIEVEDYSKVSDGYHTIPELYDHRIALYIALCKAKQDFCCHGDPRNNCSDKIVWRSKLHSDSSSYEGWFILGIHRIKGKQITYHIPLSYWDETEFAETLKKAPKWDGHTSADVITRISNL